MDSAKKFYLIIAILFAIYTPAKGQYDAHFAYYWRVGSLYNPAKMNLNQELNIIGSYSMQMVGYKGAPASLFFGANTTLPYGKEAHSGGVILMNENIGLFAHRRLLLNYAYKIALGKEGWLNIALQGGVINEGFEAKRLNLIDKNDPAFPNSNADGSSGEFGVGTLYYNKGYYIGISGLHLNSPRVYYSKESNRTSYIDIKPTFYSIGGCNIPLNNPLLSIQPSFMLATDLHFFRADATLICNYSYEQTHLFCGVTYSPRTSVAILIGGRYKAVNIGYAYELFTSGIGAINGSHDIVISYSMEVDFAKKGKNYHKSVRYL